MTTHNIFWRPSPWPGRDGHLGHQFGHRRTSRRPTLNQYGVPRTGRPDPRVGADVELVTDLDGVPVSDIPFRPGPWAPSDTAAPWHQRWLEITFLCGLAGVFLVNAVVALVQPSDFVNLVDKTAVARWFGVSSPGWVGPSIFVNDLLTGLAVLAAIWAPRSIRLAVTAWAGVWLLLVTLVKITALDVFP
jgi:hypothetical protein